VEVDAAGSLEAGVLTVDIALPLTFGREVGTPLFVAPRFIVTVSSELVANDAVRRVASG
jgi:hypothetical protein